MLVRLMSASAQIKSHRDLIVWQKAMDLVEVVYNVMHLEIAVRLRYLHQDKYSGLKNRLDEVARILNGLMRSVETSSNI